MLLKLLGSPITAPMGGFRFILEQLRDVAEREMYDEATIREDLLLLQVRLDEGEISEEEYETLEADVIARLRAAREYHRTRSVPSPEGGDDGSASVRSWDVEVGDGVPAQSDNRDSDARG